MAYYVDMKAGPNRLRVLLVDAALEVGERVKHLLEESADIELAGPAGDAAVAEQLLREFSPDLVVVDLNLPDFGSFELLKRIRRSDHRRRVIVLTNHAEPSIRERCLAEGAEHVLSKVTDLDRLLELVGDGRKA